MTPRDRIISGMRQLLEQQYLDSMSEQSRGEYAGLSDDEKRTTLRAFLQKQNDESDTEQWMKLLLILL
jgi:hypothetical protein